MDYMPFGFDELDPYGWAKKALELARAGQFLEAIAEVRKLEILYPVTLRELPEVHETDERQFARLVQQSLGQLQLDQVPTEALEEVMGLSQAMYQKVKLSVASLRMDREDN